MRVTIKDIAEKTGLSVSTVSLVLNNKKHRLSQETRDRVWAAAREMGYRPNQLAVSLVTRRSKTVGLILPDVTNMFFGEIAKGAEEESQRNGYSLILCNTNDNPQKDIDYMNVLLDRGIDGVIFVMSVTAYAHRAAECLSMLARMDRPVILVDRLLPGQDCACVRTDNELGGYLATRHLLELGHRRVGCITGPMGGQSSKQRFYGYIRALQEYRVAFDPELVLEGNFRTDLACDLTGRLLEKGVTAVFACNDMMAYGVYRRAAGMGRRVPEDLSIVGYDDLPFSEIMETPLTTVSQPARLMGERAAKNIIDEINGRAPQNREVVFEPELIVRKSSASPGGAARNLEEAIL